jgi:acetylornithine deacetylase
MKKEPPLAMNKEDLKKQAVGLLKNLIATPSFSKEEGDAATLIEEHLKQYRVDVKRHLNNVWACNVNYDENKPTLLLNSHHDTVRPNKGYTLDPFQPQETGGKLYGLGSNDAGAALVSLISAFFYFYGQKDLNYNIVLAATAEEEISGREGIESLLPLLPKIDCGIVGEPTLLEMAVAERGLMVLDCIAKGKAGHAARNEGENAIYKAMMDIEWIHSFQFEKRSELLGPVKMTVTSIETDNKAHNIVPSECRYIVDIRLNEFYTHEEVLETVRQNVQSKAEMRSNRLRSSMIAFEHPLVQAGLALGKTCYGSPTSSDKALMPFPALKIGPGDSARSHTADEFIFVDEIAQGIDLYIRLLESLLQPAL